MALTVGSPLGAGVWGLCSHPRCCSERRAAAPVRCQGTGARTPSAPRSRRGSRCPVACTVAAPVPLRHRLVGSLARKGDALAAVATADLRPLRLSQPQAAARLPPPPWRPGRARAQGRGRGGARAAQSPGPGRRSQRAPRSLEERRASFGMLRLHAAAPVGPL